MTIRYDYARRERIGMPEAILCEHKDPRFLIAAIADFLKHPDHPVLFTRLHAELYAALGATAEPLEYDDLSQTAWLHGTLPPQQGRIAVVSAGTSDLRVAMEAHRTLKFMGYTATAISDVGVAGLWRLMERVEDISSHDAVIVVAGMDAALASVVGGLVGAPIVAVPTSVGYGAAQGGATALNAMLASCAQGISVVNIDNGFGAACAAVRILRALSQGVRR